MTAEQHKLDIAGLFELKGPYSLFCWKDEITNPEPLAGPGAWRAGKMSGYLVLGSPVCWPLKPFNLLIAPLDAPA